MSGLPRPLPHQRAQEWELGSAEEARGRCLDHRSHDDTWKGIPGTSEWGRDMVLRSFRIRVLVNSIFRLTTNSNSTDSPQIVGSSQWIGIFHFISHALNFTIHFTFSFPFSRCVISLAQLELELSIRITSYEKGVKIECARQILPPPSSLFGSLICNRWIPSIGHHLLRVGQLETETERTTLTISGLTNFHI